MPTFWRSAWQQIFSLSLKWCHFSIKIRLPSSDRWHQNAKDNTQLLGWKTVGYLKKILFLDIFPFTCRLVGCTLIFLAISGLGFPPSAKLSTTPLSLLIISAFFLLLPIAKKITLGKVISFEREVAQVKEEVRQAKLDLQQSLSTYSNMISAISNTINQNINVHFHPEPRERTKAKEEIDSASSGEQASNKTMSFIQNADYDTNYALAKLRMEIEKSLRTSLGRKTTNNNPASMRSGYASARQMFSELTKKRPELERMKNSFDYIMKVCNAAIHGQQVLNNHAEEAIQMGLVLLQAIQPDPID
ncbi:hypothetical protein [Pseudomonas sp. GCEP-101]|uniref:hypothetical protein n=1 Tax=Pseudomonas sp. GCEP-101 TaxID=2974552 RepID=UPI00223B836C|nr:hypothetical protein [Pseudomonas sp. GCEP-101]